MVTIPALHQTLRSLGRQQPPPLRPPLPQQNEPAIDKQMRGNTIKCWITTAFLSNFLDFVSLIGSLVLLAAVEMETFVWDTFCSRDFTCDCSSDISLVCDSSRVLYRLSIILNMA